MSEAVVIVGSGLAGYNVARELRKADAEVPIVVISRDEAGFYSKPMLSNALAGKKTAAPAGPGGQPVKRVAILGAGLIGCEFANDLLHREIQPTVLDLAERVLPRLLPPQASASLQAKLEAGGASF